MNDTGENDKQETVIIPPGPIEPADWVDAVRSALEQLPQHDGIGQPTKLTVSTGSDLLAAITRGNVYSTACKLARISHQTFINWRERANNNEPGYFEYFELVHLAEAMAEDWHVKNIRERANTDWKASIAILERRFRARWARQNNLNLNVTGQIDHQHSFTPRIANLPTPDDFNYLAELMRQPQLEEPTEQAIEGEYREEDTE